MDKTVYGAIDEKSKKSYTNLRDVFDSINNIQMDYNWLITDIEAYPLNPETEQLLNQKYVWITGEELTELVSKEHFQWIWAVLSGFDKSVELSEVLKFDLPYADGYKGFWQKPLSLQNPLAKIEIVPWDSSLMLLLSTDKEIVDNFIKTCHKSEYLDEYIDSF